MKSVSDICITADSSIRQAMACIDSGDAQIALVVDENQRLLDTITDGDVRRAILASIDLDSPVSVLQDRRAGSPYPEPVTAPLNAERAVLLRLMQQRGVRQMPLLDESQRVAGLATLRDLLVGELLPLRAVVMAGGYGHRLKPLTDDLPKPMLPIGTGRSTLPRTTRARVFPSISGMAETSAWTSVTFTRKSQWAPREPSACSTSRMTHCW
jgi:CBS domain-containing protein